MTAAYTPGPWWVQVADDPAAGLLIKPVPGQVVAECDGVPEMAANARLIAAAPELLEALQAIMLGVAGCQREPHWEAARAALAKATGGQP